MLINMQNVALTFQVIWHCSSTEKGEWLMTFYLNSVLCCLHFLLLLTDSTFALINDWKHFPLTTAMHFTPAGLGSSLPTAVETNGSTFRFELCHEATKRAQLLSRAHLLFNNWGEKQRGCTPFHSSKSVKNSLSTVKRKQKKVQRRKITSLFWWNAVNRPKRRGRRNVFSSIFGSSNIGTNKGWESVSCERKESINTKERALVKTFVFFPLLICGRLSLFLPLHANMHFEASSEWAICKPSLSLSLKTGFAVK